MISDRILLVDDDQSLLNTLERNLGFTFPISIAESAADALKMIQEDAEGFAVVLADMRMPGMDGIELIQEARRSSPETVYMMLTGNQDLATATRAVNDGQVFRFLVKPCEVIEIKTAIQNASDHYRLVMSEKELLHKTFVGSVGLLTEIIDSMQTTVADSDQISAMVNLLATELALSANWQRQLASKLCLVGLAMMPDSKAEILRRAPTHSIEHRDVFQELSDIAAKMIERIPRLSGVADILRLLTEGDGFVPNGEDSPQVSATLVRIAFYWEILSKNGVPPSTAVAEIQRVLPSLPAKLTQALPTQVLSTENDTVVEIPASELVEGMVLVEDVVGETGALMVSKGRRLTRPVVAKLQQYSQQTGANYMFPIAAASCKTVETEGDVVSV